MRTHRPLSILRVLSILVVLAVTVVALLARIRAAERIPIDYDEDDYLRAAQQYAVAIQSGDWAAFTRVNYRSEHPPLTKIVNGVVLSVLPPAPEIPDQPTSAPPAATLPQPHLAAARLTNVLWGVLAALVLALINPVAGLFLAIDTWQIKYTTEIMLESLPSLTSLAAVAAYSTSRGRWNRWLALSGIALGLTVASKYTYGIVAAAILLHWLPGLLAGISRAAWRQTARRLAPVAAWGLGACLVFFLCDPYLWPDPIHRLADSVLYHASYAQGAEVQRAGLPFWQPLVYLVESVPWHPGAFFVSADLLFSLLALAGARRLWQTQRVMGIWLVLALGFLLAWPTKWPQYILTLTPPLMLAAAEGARAVVWEPVVRALRNWRAARMQGRAAATVPARDAVRNETRRALPWLAPGIVLLSLIALYPLVFQGAMALTDYNGLSIRDGMTGGVWREVWLGLTGQIKPVSVAVLGDGEIAVRVEIQDRGEARLVPLADSPLSTREVHFAGPGLLLQFLSGLGGELLIFEVLWTVLAVSLQAALGLGLALVLNQRGLRLVSFWRAIFILPWAIPEFVGVLIWLHVMEPTNGLLSLALKTPIPWRDNPQLALGVLLVAALWLGFPFMLLAATAGLKMVPLDVYDAAAVDGATRWQQFRHITWPLLLPLLTPAFIIRGIFAFNQFYLFYVMAPPFPLITLSTLSFYLMNGGGRGGNLYAVSATVNLVTLILLGAIILWLNRRNRITEGVPYA